MYPRNRSHKDGITVTANFQRCSSRNWCRVPWIPNDGVQETGSQRRLSTLRFRARLRTMPFGVPIKCSSVFLSRPSQIPSSHADSSLLTNAPGRLHATGSPTSKIGFRWDMCRIFLCAVVVESCRSWNRVYCHAACRGYQVSRGLSALMVIPEFFSIWILYALIWLRMVCTIRSAIPLLW